jgi:uncharacterized protein
MHIPAAVNASQYSVFLIICKFDVNYGASTIVHTAKFIEISQDLPIIIEIVDLEEKINSFVSTVDDMIQKAACGGLITIEKANVLYYKHRPKKER